jgi:hypothetical protein
MQTPIADPTEENTPNVMAFRFDALWPMVGADCIVTVSLV